MKLLSIITITMAFLVILAGPFQTAFGQPPEAQPGTAAGPATSPAEGHDSPTVPQEDRTKALKLPGLVVNEEDRCIDIDATVCLDRGALELIACTKGTKEHESIVAVDAKPVHIHAALLLLGVPQGNPAMRKALDEEGTQWIDVPPRGGAVDVFLVVNDKDGKPVERPITDFLKRSENKMQELPGDQKGDKDPNRFPTHTFLFAGSILHRDGDGPGLYLCDRSGHVISIATFGDEVLCLPDIHSSQNGALMWSVDPTYLPAVDTKIILRLRPHEKLDGKGEQKSPDLQPAQPAQ